MYCEGIQMFSFYLQHDTSNYNACLQIVFKLHDDNSVIQEEFDEFFYYLATDCKDDIPHWRELLLQDGVIKMTATEDELFMKILPAKGCKGLSDFYNCLEKCHCTSCRELTVDMLNLNMMSPSNDYSSPFRLVNKDEW